MINSVSSNNSANTRACLNSSSNSREEVDERISSQLKILRSQILTKEDKLKLAVCVIRREHFSEEELLPIPLQERLQSLMPSGFRGRRFCFEVSCLVQSKIGYNELDDDGKEKITQIRNALKYTPNSLKSLEGRLEVLQCYEEKPVQGLQALIFVATAIAVPLIANAVILFCCVQIGSLLEDHR